MQGPRVPSYATAEDFNPILMKTLPQQSFQTTDVKLRHVQLVSEFPDLSLTDGVLAAVVSL